MSMTSKTTSKIKALGDERSGSALLELMDYYNVSRLLDISEEQGQAFYKYKCGKPTPLGVGWIAQKYKK